MAGRAVRGSLAGAAQAVLSLVDRCPEHPNGEPCRHAYRPLLQHRRLPPARETPPAIAAVPLHRWRCRRRSHLAREHVRVRCLPADPELACRPRPTGSVDYGARPEDRLAGVPLAHRHEPAVPPRGRARGGAGSGQSRHHVLTVDHGDGVDRGNRRRHVRPEMLPDLHSQGPRTHPRVHRTRAPGQVRCPVSDRRYIGRGQPRARSRHRHGHAAAADTRQPRQFRHAFRLGLSLS